MSYGEQSATDNQSAVPLSHRLLEVIQRRLFDLDPSVKAASLEFASACQSDLDLDLDLKRLRVAVDFALTGAHWEPSESLSGESVCMTCGQERPCATVRSLAAKYRVI